MDIKTYKIEQYKDGSWVGAASTNPNGSFADEYAGLTEDQTQYVIDYFVLLVLVLVTFVLQKRPHK